MATQNESDKFSFLVKRALELGAADARIIPANSVVIEDRVVLKCRVGCPNYGKTLTCPPHIPSPSEFRKIVNEYSYAMFMKFSSKAEATAELQKLLSKPTNDPSITQEEKEKIAEFWKSWDQDKHKVLESVVALEKEAMRNGYSLAISFISGYCKLCEKCNTDTKICVHPELARLSEDGLGVNIRKTAENANIEYVFPFPKNPESFALLLID